MQAKNKPEIISYDESQNGKPDNTPKEYMTFSDTFRLPQGFSAASRLILRDLNGRNSSPSFSLYSKDQITDFLKDPYTNEANIRKAVVYIYGASSHFPAFLIYHTLYLHMESIHLPQKCLLLVGITIECLICFLLWIFAINFQKS